MAGYSGGFSSPVIQPAADVRGSGVSHSQWWLHSSHSKSSRIKPIAEPGITRASLVLSPHFGQGGRSAKGRLGMTARAGSGASITDLQSPNTAEDRAVMVPFCAKGARVASRLLSGAEAQPRITRGK